MAHNTHYIVVNSTSKDEAIYEVEQKIYGFGNENNYYKICEVFDLNNLTDKEVEEVNKHLNCLNEEVSEENKNYIKEKIKTYQDRADETNRHFYYILHEEYLKLFYISNVKSEYSIENLKSCKFDEYYDYKYDEYGITKLVYDKLKEDEHVYFVIIDMHS